MKHFYQKQRWFIIVIDYLSNDKHCQQVYIESARLLYNLHPLVVNVTIIEMVSEVCRRNTSIRSEVCRRNIRCTNLDFFFRWGRAFKEKPSLPGVSVAYVYSTLSFFQGRTAPLPPSSPLNHVWDDVKRVNLTGIRYNRERNLLSVEKTVISSLPM